MDKNDILDLIDAGENSSVEFKEDDIRPERLAKEAVAMANLQGGVILLGVSDAGAVVGISRPNLEEWVMDTVFGRYVHPMIIPHYQEFILVEDKRVAVLRISAGTAKPYVVRHNDREDMYVRIGSTTRLATREQALRLFSSGGLLHAETLPVSGSSVKDLDRARIDNYLQDILQDPEVPDTEEKWLDRLHGLGFLTTDSLGQPVCSVAGLALFGVKPRRYLPQSGLRLMVFDVADKQYQALLDVVLDAPMVGRWNVEEGKIKTLIDDGLVEKFIRAIEPFISVEADRIDKNFRREKTWLYPLDAIRETVLNALVHRDWTRSVDIEITRYSDRLEVTSPGALPNSMTIEKMKAGRRTPRNPISLEVMRDYGYVDARGMGVRTKVIPLTRQFTGSDPVFEASDDFLKTTIFGSADPGNVPGKEGVTQEKDETTQETTQEKETTQETTQEKILLCVQKDPSITRRQMAEEVGISEDGIKYHLTKMREGGILRHIGPTKAGYWEIQNSSGDDKS